MCQNTVEIKIDENDFDIDATLGCGQCFRWEQLESGAWEGVASARKLALRREGSKIIFTGASPSEFENIWFPYFDLGRDYDKIKRVLNSDPVMREAIAFAPGLRLLKQEPWESLCSFIISQNNNIPRIKGIVARLCECFGEKIPGGGFSFPSARRIACLSLQDLAPLRSGFRAQYILDAAQKVASGEIDLKSISRMPVEEARKDLIKIKGVGPKVAECTLLYGCGRMECFPVDVWIRRVLRCLYPQGFPRRFKNEAGIAQQYLFHYARCCPSCELAQAEGA